MFQQLNVIRESSSKPVGLTTSRDLQKQVKDIGLETRLHIAELLQSQRHVDKRQSQHAVKLGDIRHCPESSTNPAQVSRIAKISRRGQKREQTRRSTRTSDLPILSRCKGSLTEGMMENLTPHTQTAFYLNHSYTYQIQNIKGGRVMLFSKIYPAARE